MPATPGERKLTVEVVEQPGELVTTNNRVSTFVNVLKGGLRVLYLEGFPPRVEQNFLRRALDASPDINVDTFTIDRRRPETRPADLGERLQPGRYEAYILGDLDSSAFEAGELQNLADTVSRGAGLIMLGGWHSFGAGGYADTPLADVLPVRMNRLERQALDSPPRTDLHLEGPVRMTPTEINLGHFTMLLGASPQENRKVWQELPPLEGANKFFGMKPLASVLAESGKKEPLLVAHRFGGGRVMGFAGDSTWRWQMQGFGNAHKRFWRQVLAAKRRASPEGNVWVDPPQRAVQPRQPVEFAVGVLAHGRSGDRCHWRGVRHPIGRTGRGRSQPDDGRLAARSETFQAGDAASKLRARRRSGDRQGVPVADQTRAGQRNGRRGVMTAQLHRRPIAGSGRTPFGTGGTGQTGRNTRGDHGNQTYPVGHLVPVFPIDRVVGGRMVFTEAMGARVKMWSLW